MRTEESGRLHLQPARFFFSRLPVALAWMPAYNPVSLIKFNRHSMRPATLCSRPAVWAVLFSLTTLTACGSKEEEDEPAPLPGRWTLVTQHSVNTDASTGQIITEQHQPGTAGDYLEVSTSTFEEYRGNQLHFTAPYTYSRPTISMQGTNPRTDLSREVRELTSRKLVLYYQLPAIVMNQKVTIEATYSR
ncbi:hypothetical protein Hsw_2350 [Hymenobacter swuensis DY53]|uniref:Uncharacterized protein n=2 Tax=Hymenobacter TaxID=89966 RepID=W8F8C6_9BACT|nr:hypothetical protein Hsw_2350 [Hymenobacter swuensis DY53]